MLIIISINLLKDLNTGKVNKIMRKVFLILTFLFLINLVNAVSVPDTQREINIILEEQTSEEILLIVQNMENKINVIDITCSGDCNLIKFGDEKYSEYNVSLAPYSSSFIPITITSGNFGRRFVEIEANEQTISEINIKVVPSYEEIVELQTIDKTNVEIERLKNELKQELQLVNKTNSEIEILKNKIENDIKQIETKINETEKNLGENFAGDINDLEAMLLNISAVQGNIIDIVNQSSNMSTGSFISSTSVAGLFVFGLFFGVLLVYVIHNRKRIIAKLADLKRKYFTKRYNFSKSQSLKNFR